MKKIVVLLFFVTAVVACNNSGSAPEVSGITVDLSVKRFDQDFFSIDTLALENGMAGLQQKYPGFLRIFLQNIVGVNDPEGIRAFFRLYKPIYDSSQLIYHNLGSVESEIKQALRYVKYYFPSYKTPAFIMPVIGPMNTREDLARMNNGDYTPNFIGPDFVGISLQFYLGKNYSLYSTEYFINNVAPLYRSRRFDKIYITADVMKLIADDLFPDRSNNKPLIEQIIEKGKQWWLLDKFLPQTPDSVKTGYTQSQLNWCKSNEGLIWAYILKNEDLYSINPATIQTYIGESPFTSVFSQEASPGNIGPWIGWQIVKEFAEKNSDMKPGEIMQVSPAKILEEAKYKPK